MMKKARWWGAGQMRGGWRQSLLLAVSVAAVCVSSAVFGCSATTADAACCLIIHAEMRHAYIFTYCLQRSVSRAAIELVMRDERERESSSPTTTHDTQHCTLS